MRRKRIVIGALVMSVSIAVANNTPTSATNESAIPTAVVGPILKVSKQAAPINPQALAEFIAVQMGAIGSAENVSAIVVDDATGDVLFSQQANRAMIPASTLKLLTAAGVLSELGLENRFATTVVQEGQTLTLVGGGDPTLVSQTPANWRGKPPGVEQPPSLDQLADLVAQKLVGSTEPFTINIDDSYFSSESRADSWPGSYISQGFVSPVTGLTVDFGVDDNNRAYKDPSRFAGEYLASALTARGFVASFGKNEPASAAAAEIAQLESARLVDIVERMVTTSNNTMAEYLSHHVGKKNGDDSFAGSAQYIFQAIAKSGINTTDLEISDGSGLSGNNKVSPQTIVDVIRQAHNEKSATWPLLSGLPIAGVSGTLEERFAATDSGRGFVRAKTGTLSGVVSLAGSLTTASGHVVDFAVMVNGVASTSATEKDVDSLIKRLSECGCG